MSVALKNKQTRRELGRIKKLYKSAFPLSERKPFSMILKMRKRGKSDIWHFSDEDGFLGLATTVRGEGTVLIDYFAVSEERRGSGAGSAMMRELIKQYTGWGIFLEIERPQGDGGVTDRRLAFYERAGYSKMDVAVKLFGVDMILLGIDCELDFEEYRDFYCRNIGTFAYSHIKEL